MAAPARASDTPPSLAPGNAKALQATGLSKTFRAGGRVVHALRDVSFSVRPGIVTGLIGPDSAGKTTLMRLAAGLLVPDQGSIMVLGMDASRQPLQVQGTIGYMPQRFGLYEDLTVQENLDLYADLQGVPETARADRYAELLHMAGLAPFTRRLAGQLSGGMKQKLGLACALVRQPPLLLLDEPTVGVDPVSRRELWAIVYRLVKQHGTSVLLSTAYLDEAERCDEVVLLHDGALLDQGTPEALREPVRGRTFAVIAADLPKRALQATLAQAPGVLDALVQGEHVRVVMERAEPPDLVAILPDANASRSGAGAATLRGRLRHPAQGADAAAGCASHPRRVGAGCGCKIRQGDDRSERSAAALRQFLCGAGNQLFGVSRARCSACWVPTAPASPPPSACCAGCCRRAAAPCAWPVPTCAPRRHAARARIGYMSQKFSLYGNLSVAENLRFFSSAYGLSGRRGSERIDWALQEFDLAPMAQSVSGDLSLGLQAAAGAGLRADARAGDPVSRRAHFRRRPAGAPRILAAHQRTRGAGRDRHGDHALHGGGGILRPPGHHGGGRDPYHGHARGDQGQYAVRRAAGTDHGRRLRRVDRGP